MIQQHIAKSELDFDSADANNEHSDANNEHSEHIFYN